MYQVKVYDDKDVPQVEARMMTEQELDALEEGLPDGWYTVWV